MSRRDLIDGFENTHNALGTPFDPYYSPYSNTRAEKRVMPYQFSFLTVPMNCTFIKNTETDTKKN